MARTRKTLPIRVAPEPKRPIPSAEEALGRNLAAAFIATQHGIGLDYARKKCADQPIGGYWTTLARKMIEDLSNRAAPPERTPTIQ